MTFYRRLGKKTETDPRSGAERELRLRLDEAFAKDFGVRPARDPFAWFTGLEIFRFAPIAAAAALLLTLGAQLERTHPKADSPIAFAFAADDIEASWLDGKGDRVEFYDEEMEDWMLTASDEDWDALLEKEG